MPLTLAKMPLVDIERLNNVYLPPAKINTIYGCPASDSVWRAGLLSLLCLIVYPFAIRVII
jgi:hypothetical protein